MRRITATLGIRRRIEGELDMYGNPRVSHGDPEPWPVYAVAPRASTEPGEANRDLVLSGLTVYAPASGPRPDAHDLVTYRSEDWQVTGDVGEWDRNPHVTLTSQHGIVVNLDRTEG